MILHRIADSIVKLTLWYDTGTCVRIDAPFSQNQEERQNNVTRDFAILRHRRARQVYTVAKKCRHDRDRVSRKNGIVHVSKSSPSIVNNGRTAVGDLLHQIY
jgi:hypothetical protein